MDLLLRFGASVRSYRESFGLSQEELADRAGLDRTYLSGIERGVRNPTLRTVERISAALGVAPTALLAEPTKTPMEISEKL